MATTAFVREIHSYMSINSKEQQSPEQVEMPPHDDPQHVSSTSSVFERPSHHQDSGKSSPDSCDSNDIPIYSYSALQQMQAVYGSAVLQQQQQQQSSGYAGSPSAALPKCRLCDYIPLSEQDSDAHIMVHFPYKCSKCNYMAKTEGRLKNHESKFHCLEPPATWVGSKGGVPRGKRSPPAQGAKPKKRPVKCKLCGVVSIDKSSYYDHLRQAHNDPKLLKCEQCPFVTHYKHHLEYHVRNHFGSKPYKCNLCNYSCVNKSMLNSHKKSHSNVYQFHCAQCTYATKYCHSLKMHLLKYEHKPGATLNPDGTPNTTAIIDIYGRRRGPKNKKKKEKGPSNKSQITDARNNKQHLPKLAPNIPLPQPTVYLNPKVYNNFSGTVFYRPSLVDNSNYALMPRQQLPQFQGQQREVMCCPYCEFYSEPGPVLTAHVMAHMGMDPKHLFQYNYMDEEVMRMRMQNLNPYKPDTGHGNYFAPKVGETSPTAFPANAADGNASPPSNGDSSDAYSSPRSNPDVYSEWAQQTTEKVQPDFPSPPSSALNLSGTKTSSPDPKPSPPPDRCQPINDASSVLDLSVKSSPSNAKSDRQRPETSSPTTSQSSSTSPGANEQPVPPTRNRRKGKAFKLDCYVREEELGGDFSMNKSETEQVLENPMNCSQASRTSPKSVVGSQMPNNNALLKRQLETETSVNDVYKMPPLPEVSQNREGNFQQQYQPPCFSPPASQIGVNNAQLLTSPNRSLYPPNNSKTAILSPDQSFVPNNNTPQMCGPKEQQLPTEPAADNPVPAVTIKTEPMDMDVDVIGEYENPSKIFRCFFCDLIFGDFNMYGTHMRFHTVGDPFTCGSCGVKCYDRLTLYNHLLNTPHHDEDGEVRILGVVRR